jgi:integrase
MSKRAKPGRPPKYVADANGRPVVGLSFDKNNNFYFNTHWKTDNLDKQIFGNDRSEAIARFRIWQSEQQGQTTKIEDASPHQIQTETTVTKELSEPELKVLNDIRKQAGLPELPPKHKIQFGTNADSADVFGKDFVVGQTYTLLEGIFWKTARELILNDIHKARKLLNLPIFIDGKVLSEKSITLQEIGDLYFDKRRKPISYTYKKDGLRFWKEFCKCVGVSRVGDVILELIDRYEDYLYASLTKHKWSSASLNNRIALVKSVLSNAVKRVNNPSDIEHLRTALQYADRLTRAEKAKVNPCPIKCADYHKMLNCTKNNKTYRAILLMALNCGMKESDIINIRISPRKGQPKPDINLTDKTLQMPRHKSGIIGVAMLWDRTVAAINEMLAEREKKKVKSEYLFLNSLDRPMQADNILRWWLRHRERAGVDKSVKFKHIRNSTQTIPLDKNSHLLVETYLILAHSLPGVGNNYLERRPKMVRKACAAIEKYYFGKKS